MLFNDAVICGDYVASVIDVEGKGETNPCAVLLQTLGVPGG